MVCSNQPTEDGRSPQAGRATLASHQARAGLGHAEGIPNADDADDLDIVEALVSDACAAESPRGVHEGGEYYAERIVRRAIEQGTLALAAPPEGHPAYGEGYPIARAIRSMRHVLKHDLELFSNRAGYSSPCKTDGYLAAKVPDWLLRQWIAAAEAQVDGNPKGGDAKQAPGDSLTARSRSDAPNPTEEQSQ